jgi:hypothetical protein
MMYGTRSLRSFALVVGMSLAVVACGGDDTVGDTLLEDTSPIEETTTTVTDTTGAEVAGAGAAELEARADALAVEIAAIDNDQIQASWDALRARLDELFAEIDAGTTLDEELVQTVSDELTAFDLIVEQNAAELTADFQAEWDEFLTELEASLSVS